MSATPSTSLLSGRAQDRLSQLHRVLTNELRSLTTQHSLLFGALQACDTETQGSVLREYFDRIATLKVAAERLHAFVSRHLLVTPDTSANVDEG